MKRATGVHLPRIRKQKLIVDELPDEVLVYDLDRHKAHCLNSTAAMVWRRCDGKTRPAEIARRLQGELDQPFNAKLATSDMDVRRTWILPGDPSMRLK